MYYSQSNAWGQQNQYQNQYYYNLIRDIEEYIQDELKDSRYYAILATKAPTERAKQLLMEFSKDEQMHAQNFMHAYFMLTGRRYHVPVIQDPIVPAYEEALKQRILAESGDFEKYGKQYLKAPNSYLRNLFYMTQVKEGQHAMRIPFLLHEK